MIRHKVYIVVQSVPKRFFTLLRGRISKKLTTDFVFEEVWSQIYLDFVDPINCRLNLREPFICVQSRYYACLILCKRVFIRSGIWDENGNLQEIFVYSAYIQRVTEADIAFPCSFVYRLFESNTIRKCEMLDLKTFFCIVFFRFERSVLVWFEGFSFGAQESEFCWKTIFLFRFFVKLIR